MFSQAERTAAGASVRGRRGGTRAVTDPATKAPTPPPAPDPELEALQQEVAKIMAEPEAIEDAAEGVQQAMDDLDQAAAELSQQLAEAPVVDAEEEKEEPAPEPSVLSQEDTAALDSILAEQDPPAGASPELEAADEPSVAAADAAPEPAPPADSPSPVDAELHELISAVTKSIEVEAANLPAPAPEAAEVGQEPAVEAPADAPDVEAVAEAPAEPVAVALPAPVSIEDVDARVASEAEREIAHEEAQAAKEEAEVAAAPVAAPVAAPAPAAAPVAAAVPAPQPVPVAQPKPEPVAPRPEPIVEKKPKVPGFFKTKVEGPLLRTVGLVSKPVASKPGYIGAAGLLSICTLVMGAGLWVYTLYFRPAHATPEGQEVFDFAHSGLPQPEHEPGESHASAHGGGGEHGEPAAEGHGAKKEEGHGAKKEDGHGAKKEGGGGGHGTSAKPAEPKKSIIASSGTKYVVNEKMSKKPGEKPKEAKSGGH